MLGSPGGTESSVFVIGESCDDTKLFATFKRCESDHDACATTGYHVECSAIASNLGLQKNDFLDVARYSYEPSSKEDERRLECILNHLHQAMSKKFAKLPTEILFIINKHLVLYYAIASLSGLRQPGRWTIEPFKDVWATHFSLNSIDYIASLSNEPKPGSRLLWKAPESREDQHIYISEDHLGITQIANDPLAASVEERHSGWWRTLPIASPLLTFSGDVSSSFLKICCSHIWLGPQIAECRSCPDKSHHLLAVSNDPKITEEHGLPCDENVLFKLQYDCRSPHGSFELQRTWYYRLLRVLV